MDKMRSEMSRAERQRLDTRLRKERQGKRHQKLVTALAGFGFKWETSRTGERR